MKTNNQKRYIILAIIVIVVLLVTAAFSDFAWKGKKSVESMPVSYSAKADWPTYTDGKYGFSMTFPVSWKGYRVTIYPDGYDNNDGIYTVHFGLYDQDHVFGVVVMTEKEYSDCLSSEFCPRAKIDDDGKIVVATDGEADFGQKVANSGAAYVLKEITSSIKLSLTTQDKNVPVITSINPQAVVFNNAVTINGSNLNGHTVYVWLENESGKVMAGAGSSVSPEYNKISFQVQQKFCYVGEPGTPCNNWQIIKPGKYMLYVNTFNGTNHYSNKLPFIITSQ